MDATSLTAGGNGVLGCWLIAAPFVLGAPAVGRWNDVLAGTAVVVVAGYNYARDGERPASATGATLVAILGCWLVVAPFALDFEGAVRWSDVVTGTLVAAFGGYDAYVATVVGRDPTFRATAE